jgi:hypothetical protein
LLCGASAQLRGQAGKPGQADRDDNVGEHQDAGGEAGELGQHSDIDRGQRGRDVDDDVVAGEDAEDHHHQTGRLRPQRFEALGGELGDR